MSALEKLQEIMGSLVDHAAATMTDEELIEAEKRVDAIIAKLKSRRREGQTE